MWQQGIPKDMNDQCHHHLPSREPTPTIFNKKASSFFGTTEYNGTENLKSRNFTSFTAYFTLGYYFGVIPFRPQFDRDSDRWKLKKSWIQRVSM